MKEELTSELILQKMSSYKRNNDTSNELSLIEVLVELADKEGIELDEFTDVLSDSDNFKTILREDLSARGLMYMNGVRLKMNRLEDW
jgi:predicted DsbA family dithiol-disulfide isomerase